MDKSEFGCTSAEQNGEERCMYREGQRGKWWVGVRRQRRRKRVHPVF